MKAWSPIVADVWAGLLAVDVGLLASGPMALLGASYHRASVVVPTYERFAADQAAC
jgi:hypothetical protein